MKDFADRPVHKVVRSTKRGKKRNDEIVGAMYALYQTGKSCSYVARFYRKDVGNVRDMFVRRGYVLRRQLLPGLQIIDGIKFTERNWRGYRNLTAKIEGKHVQMSRYVWEKHHGPIPIRHRIHFINGNNHDVRIENLQLLSFDEWNKKYHRYRNQFTSPTGSRKTKMSVREKAKAEREARWQRISAI
jgi:hypothetical protein